MVVGDEIVKCGCPSCVPFLFSIFVAFILEAFFVEYSLEKSEVETAIEKKIQELGIGIKE